MLFWGGNRKSSEHKTMTVIPPPPPPPLSLNSEASGASIVSADNKKFDLPSQDDDNIMSADCSVFYRVQDCPVDVPFAHDSVVFTGARREYLNCTKELQDVLFPVKYSDRFYESLIDPKEQMLTVLAFLNQRELKQFGEAMPKIFDGLVGVATAKIHYNKTLKCREGYISTLGVSPFFRCKGLGKSLLKNIISALSGRFRCPRITLHVKDDNVAAIRLYESVGFQVVQKLLNHYYFDDAYHNALELLYLPPISDVEADGLGGDQLLSFTPTASDRRSSRSRSRQSGNGSQSSDDVGCTIL